MSAGRHAEHVGDVVEAGRRIVRRQQRADVDVEREQVANGVGVLGAVEPMQRRRARDRDAARQRDRAALRAPRVNVSRAAGAGFGAPSGGIMPVRSLRTTFSHTSACPSTPRRSSPSSARPPLFARVVVTLTQYLLEERRVGRRRGRRGARRGTAAPPSTATRSPSRRSAAHGCRRADSRASSSSAARAAPWSTASRPASWWRGRRPRAHAYGVRPSLSGTIELARRDARAAR